MRRRNFIALLGGAAAWPLTARAQQPAMPVVGLLLSGSPDQFADRVRALRQGLSETGYVDGRNMAIEFRWGEGQYNRLPALASDLARREVNVIVTDGPAVMPAKVATTKIPIVFFIGGDPVQTGLVASLNRPGGNLTGMASLSEEVSPKRLELLHELLPDAAVVAFLNNPSGPTAESQSQSMQAAAFALGLQIHTLNASTERDFEMVFATLGEVRAGGLVIGLDPLFTSHSEQLAVLALRRAIPAIFQSHEFVAAGGLMSYGGNITDQYRQVGVYAGRILKGEKPGELPVQQATKFELVINLKTAKALGLTVPLALLTRADEVIE
jgi:putative ABC transport system substrate-binding protein